jgi:hypothetical protein
MLSILFLQQHVFLEGRFEVSSFTYPGYLLIEVSIRLCAGSLSCQSMPALPAQYFIPSGDSEVQRKPLLER